MEEKVVTDKRITLKDLQNTLPIHDKEKTDQTFTFREWGMAEEEKLAKMKGENPTMGKFVSSVLCLMLKSLHGEDFEGLEEKKKKLVINQMHSGNVLYLYMYLRYDQIDDRLALGFKCPFCAHDIKEYVVSLNDLDVDCKHGQYEDHEEYDLRKPITLEKGSQLVETLKLGLTKWDTIERAEHSNVTREYEGMKSALLSGIAGVKGVDGFVNVDEIVSKLRKVDIEYIHAKLSKHNAGPDIQVEVKCDKCGNKAFQTIDWTFDSFFGVSSLPQP